MFQLANKKILVTGASSGIGRAIAIVLSQVGASVIITARNKERLNKTLGCLECENGQVHYQKIADLDVDDQIEQLVLACPLLDGVVCCSGINDKAPIKHITREKVERMYGANVYGPMLLIKELLKKKKINKEASIVFISSISSYYATISNAMYASSKGAINSLVRVLALELAPKKIRVNSILPGMVKTSMIDAYGLCEDELARVVDSYPLGRIGDPNDIANAAVFFLSDASSWITGASLVVDGGISLR